MTTRNLYYVRGTPIVWTNTGGDKLLNGKALAHSTGRLGAFYDRGAGAAPIEYEVQAYTRWAANPTLNTALAVALFGSDGTHQDCGVAYHADNDAALTLAQIEAAPGYVGDVVAYIADTNEKGGIWLARISARYFAPGIYNRDGAQTLVNTDSLTAVVVTPIYPQLQAEA